MYQFSFMAYLEVLDKEDAPEESQEILSGIESDIGMIPNLYAVMAHSPTALKAYLQFDEALSGGEFSDKEVQAVLLAASEQNACGYCASAHTLLGKQTGWSKEETHAIRRGDIKDDRIQPLVRLTQEIVDTRGHASDETIQAFFDAGYSKAAFIELHGLVAVKTFTNYINHAVETPIDFPKAEELETELV